MSLEEAIRSDNREILLAKLAEIRNTSSDPDLKALAALSTTLLLCLQDKEGTCVTG